MPVDVLRDEGHSLDVAVGMLDNLQGQLEAYDRLLKQASTMTQQIVSLALALPGVLRERWQDICREVTAGKSEEAQRGRGALDLLVSRQRTLLERAGELATLLARVAGEEVPRAGEIPAVIAEVDRFREKNLTPWKTVEDLEDLVAAQYHLPTARLDAIGAAHPAPPAWYEQDSKPF
jgi:hypothetical protein